MYMYMYMYMSVSLCLLCGAVSRRVSRVVARYVLFLVRDLSLVVDCPSLCCAPWFCVVACCCCCRCGLFLVFGVSAHSRVCCLICWLLAGSSGLFFSSLSLSLPPRPPSLSRPRVSTQIVTVCTFKTSHVRQHHAHMLKHMCACCWYTQGRFESECENEDENDLRMIGDLARQGNFVDSPTWRREKKQSSCATALLHEEVLAEEDCLCEVNEPVGECLKIEALEGKKVAEIVRRSTQRRSQKTRRW